MTNKTQPMLSGLTFAQRFKQFCELVLRESGEEFLSFQDGLPWQWESYKSEVRIEARRRLQSTKWTDDDVGSGH